MSHKPNAISIARSAGVLRTLVLLILMSLPFYAALDAAAEPGERLSISVTNKYGDVFTNLTVARILGDGLLLEHKAGQLKVKYEDLPPAVRTKYQPLAAAAAKKEEDTARANALFIAKQAETVAAEKASANGGHSFATDDWKIEVPDQGWKLVIFNPGLKAMYMLTNENSFSCRSLPGQNGCNLSIFVEKAPVSDAANEDVSRYYWSRASRNPLIDGESVKAEKKQKFVKVSYTVLGIHNVNFYFVFKDRWIDVHLSKAPFGDDDEKLFAEFEDRLHCEE